MEFLECCMKVKRENRKHDNSSMWKMYIIFDGLYSNNENEMC